MKALIAGGKLQGVEAVYLAQKAGWETLVIDKRKEVPAKGFCHSFRQLDLLEDEKELVDLMQKVDFIIPALENLKALNALYKTASMVGVPFAWDRDSYMITTSKKKSDSLFAEHDIPAPSYWPKCSLPVIAKPTGMSGSKGVRKISGRKELESFLLNIGPASEDYVVQEFLEGKALSLEVLGCKGKYLTLQVTELETDKYFDCKRVWAPVRLEPILEKRLRKQTQKIAGLLNLTGIMDIEVIIHKGLAKVLEIDARLPSQTPSAVLHSSGLNLLKVLAEIFIRGNLPQDLNITAKKCVIYEHIKVGPEGIEALGEHVMATAYPLKHIENFFGADEALSDFEPGRKSWVATLIITSHNRMDVWKKRCQVIAKIKKDLQLKD